MSQVQELQQVQGIWAEEWKYCQQGLWVRVEKGVVAVWLSWRWKNH